MWRILTAMLVVGCGTKAGDAGKGHDSGDADTQVNADSGGDTDTQVDSAGHADTVIAGVWYAGDAQTTNEGSVYTWVTGHFGYDVLDRHGASICVDESEWADDGNPPAANCPGCILAF